MGYPISISTPTGHISGWRADPSIPPRGAIVLIQEVFGVNSHIRRQVDRFAEQGFICLAPAFFDHFEAQVELAYDDKGITRGRGLVEKLGFDRAVADVEAAMRELPGEIPVGVVGYCWGGTVAYLANTRLGLPAVSYYGARTIPFVHERLRAPMMFHFGETDTLIPPEAVQAHRDAQPDASLFVYPRVGHGFNCDERGAYDAEASKLAMERTVDFFTQALKPAD